VTAGVGANADAPEAASFVIDNDAPLDPVLVGAI